MNRFSLPEAVIQALSHDTSQFSLGFEDVDDAHKREALCKVRDGTVTEIRRNGHPMNGTYTIYCGISCTFEVVVTMPDTTKEKCGKIIIRNINGE